MTLDLPTVLVLLIVVILLTSASYLFVWLQDRRQTAMLWMAAAALIGGVSFAIGPILPFVLDVFVPGAGIQLALSCVWMACRTLHGRRVHGTWLVATSLTWFVVALVPGVASDASVRAVITGTLAAGVMGLAATELLRNGGGGLVARWWVAGILLAEALLSFARGLFEVLRVNAPTLNPGIVLDFGPLAITVLVFMVLLSASFVALAKEQSDRRQGEAALTDGLTGLGNRRRLDDALEDAVHQSARSGRPLSVLMIDIDSFKTYNDGYGHVQGDACLRAVAQALTTGLVRRQDRVMRYGGEEFTVVLPETTAAEAFGIAERLRLAVKALGLPHTGRSEGVVTISLGVAAIAPDQTGVADLLRAADRALYEAKHSGRDRTITAS